MIDKLLLLCIALSFSSTVLLTVWWMGAAKKAGIAGKDMNKFHHPMIPEIGGLPVLCGFLLGLLVYVGYRAIFLGTMTYLATILAATLTIVLMAMIGMIDDILGWKLGLKQWQKPLFTLFAALPMMMINAGVDTMTLPFIGVIHLGIIYPLVIVPLAIVFAANAYNMLAGFNGLEAGQGMIILTTLGYIAWQYENLGYVAMLAALMVASLAAFILFNWYPAKIFPGDTLNYMVGAMIAIIAILGNVEKAALILFIPYIIEFFLKAKGRFKHETFGKPEKDGTIRRPYKKVYSLTHFFMVLSSKGGKGREQTVVLSCFAVELLLVLIVILWGLSI
ncbi:glycosyl transferase family 4 [Candidatus Woesearchaeota archaeon]|nr:MAG: UDP-N-acetylglucosamine-dolichyl-phosphate N-acetylglucosaminephosphotransferase [archaeon GW2011_AR4]MBS3129105.1 glycosyl transferase family 4 [Candidatus Woesearchaeota archaeon]HIH37837.1 glycosyl transferase family 4 [Candidatus Woesearchaeota archaeon]HIH49267.1 glycosyl transferase family 4 [Candidatus Woesearchaeota archaeon]HIJ03962.1 glycosyl transferase family 4 [Candidatus Woesearchaeota archaeon]